MTDRSRELKKELKGVGVPPPPSPSPFPVILCDSISINPLMRHGASLLALSRFVLTFASFVKKGNGGKNPLCSLANYNGGESREDTVGENGWKRRRVVAPPRSLVSEGL